MRDFTQLFDFGASVIRAAFFSALGKTKFTAVGRHFRFYGIRYIQGRDVSVFDDCWFEAVSAYRGTQFSPRILLGRGTKFGRSVHISCIERIEIGADSLFGSNIYIGDHSHGTTDPARLDLSVPPADRQLDDAAPISIGERVWVGDGVVILAGSRIADGSIVGANSVVRGVFDEPAIIAGAPARVIRRL